MTTVRECFVLPGIFLTVTLLGGLRIAQSVRLLPPPTVALVLGLLLVGCLVRASVLAPDALMNGRRNGLANVSGLVVLLSLFAACVQMFNLVTPERGLLHVIFATFFFVQLLTTLAAVRGRLPFLRGLMVLLGSAFVLRFIVLESLYSPEGGTLKRVLTALLEGVTVGSLEYAANSTSTGYVAFVALVLFLAGVLLLPAPGDRPGASAREELLPVRKASELLRPPPGILLVCALSAATCARADPDADRVVDPRAAAQREAALAAARVWNPPAVPVTEALLDRNPPGGWQDTDDVECRFVMETVGGMTPKFNCALADGEIVKVKYGRANQELYVEVAATRLLTALGFGADHMFAVRSVRCAGCPPYPYQALTCFERTGLESLCSAGAFDERVVTFDHAVVERRLTGRRIEAFEDQGWAWFELEKVDPARGGASRAELDALRLIAVVLAHWDNKSSNQRLLCPPSADRPGGSCQSPLAIVQDLGSTFGPHKLDLHNWKRTPVWAHPGECRVSMKRLPWGGGTFPDWQISEDGRVLLLRLLEQLSRRQLEQLFDSSGMTRFDAINIEARRAGAWVDAFFEKVRELRAAGPCPPARPFSSAAAR